MRHHTTRHALLVLGALLFPAGEGEAVEFGWLVAEFGTTPPEVRVYQVDNPAAPVQVFPGALFERDEVGRPMRVGTFGVVYAVPEILGTTEYEELGIFVSSVPVVLGAEPNHRYRWMGMIPSSPPRVVFRDNYDIGGGLYSLRSARLDGGDARELVTGCTQLQAPADAGPDPVVAASGIVFRCTTTDPGPPPTNVQNWWYSDGVGPAVKLAYAGNDGVREPKALFPDWVVMYYPAPSYHLTTQPLDGIQVEKNLFEGELADVSHELEYDPATGRPAIGPGGELVVKRFRAGGFNRARHVRANHDGSGSTFGGNEDQVPYGSIASFENVSPDGTKFISRLTNAVGQAYIVPFDVASGVTPMDLGGDSAIRARFLPNGKIIVNKCEPASCSQAAAATGNFIARPDGTLEAKLLTPQTFQPVGAFGNYAILEYAGVADLRTIDSVALSESLLCTDCGAPSLTTRPDGYVTFVDGGFGKIGPLSDLGQLRQIDSIPTTRVENVGDGPGNRIFLQLRRNSGDEDIVVFDKDTLTTTPLLTGIRGGFFLPIVQNSYVLDGFGGVHAGGGALPMSHATPYFGFDIAKDLELASTGFYVLDGFGGVHAGGGAPGLSPSTPYFGFDIAKDIELASTGYYVLDGFGGVHGGGGALAPIPATPYFGFDIAKDLELASTGFYVLDGFGGVHAGGGAPGLSPSTPYFGFDIAKDIELASTGYYVLDGFGGVHRGGGASALTPVTPYFGFNIARDLEMALTGYYVLDGFGGVHPGFVAPAMNPATPYFGFNIARDLELR